MNRLPIPFALAASLFLTTCVSTETVESHLEDQRHRAVAGVSMGAIGASLLGTAHPELFDGVGALGGPLDARYFLYYLEEHYLGGFCSLEELEAILAAHPEEPEVLDDPSRLPCMEAAPAQFEAVLPERRQRYDRWAYGSSGGTFDRDLYLDLFEDLILAFGNPLYETAPGAPFPPGITEEILSRPDICQRPHSLPGVVHPTLNPQGRYPLVTFCDGERPKPYCLETMRAVDVCAEPDPEVACEDEGGVAFATAQQNAEFYLEEVGTLSPCVEGERVVPFALAVDVNENGRRDAGEPILVMGGEASPGRQRLLEQDPSRVYEEEWSEAERERVAFYLDGGIRDIFHFGIHADRFFQTIEAHGPQASRRYEGTTSFPGAPATEDAFAPFTLAPDDLPQNTFYLYGNPDASPAQIDAGDGEHVGTTRQVMNRLFLFLRWISLRWEGLDDPPSDRSSFWSRVHSSTYVSAALGGKERDYAVVLPPGYDDPKNADVAYPVVFLLHGYGQRASGPGGFWESFLLTDGRMASGEIRKMILVFPSGRCCATNESTGETVCTEEEAAAPGFERECHSGSFYTHSPITGRDYQGAIVDLIAHVDATYRTLAR